MKGSFFAAQGGVMDYRKAMNAGIGHLAEVRAAVGPDFDVIVELHGKATPAVGIEFCNRAEEFRPLWVEEVSQLESEVLPELRQIRSQTRVPLATGERPVPRYDFAPLCSERLVDVIMPDIVHCGGISEMKKIAAIAEAFRVAPFASNQPDEDIGLHLELRESERVGNCPRRSRELG